MCLTFSFFMKINWSKMLVFFLGKKNRCFFVLFQLKFSDLGIFCKNTPPCCSTFGNKGGYFCKKLNWLRPILFGMGLRIAALIVFAILHTFSEIGSVICPGNFGSGSFLRNPKLRPQVPQSRDCSANWTQGSGKGLAGGLDWTASDWRLESTGLR